MIQRSVNQEARRKPGWVGPLVVFAVALILRLIHLYEIKSNPFFYHPIIDAWDYHNDAVTILQTGDWIGDRAFFQAPLTTYFLAVVYSIAGTNLMWPRVVQAVIGSLTAMGIFLLGRRLFSDKAAWIGGMVAGFYPLFIFFDGELLAPTLTLFLDVVFLLLLFRVAGSRTVWSWALPGFILGLRALATTNILALVPLFWIWAFLKGRSQHWRPRRVLLAIVAFTLGITVVLVPVTVRNWVLHKQPVLVSSNAGLNFYLGNSGDYDAKIAIRAGADWEEFINQHVRAGRRVGPEMSGYLFEQAREYIAANPVEYLRLLIYKTYLFLKGDEIMRNQEIYAFRAYSTLLKSLLWKLGVPGGPGLAFPFGVLLPLAWPGCLLVLRKRHPEGLLLLAYGAGYSLTVIAFFITARYRLPVVLPITLLFAYGWSQAREWWNPAGVRVAAISGMVILGLISNWNSGPMPREMNPDAYYNLGRTLTNQGDLAGAEHYYRKALEMDPQDAAAWVSLGLHVYQETGALGKAESCYRQALEVRPGYATPVFNLGVVAERRNMPAQAESLYREAARLDPLFAAPHINLAVMALSRKDYRRAYEHYRQAYLRNPEDPEALVGLGVTAFETRGLAEALDFFNQAIGLDPSFPDTYFNLALVYTKLSDPGKAAYYARRAAELDPTDGDAYIIFADQMRSAGRTGEARKFLEEAIRRHPNLPGPREALEHLMD